MHARSRTWNSLGAALPAEADTGVYRYPNGSVSVSDSNDGWTRLRVSLHAGPPVRPSLAVDPHHETDRIWTPRTDIDSSEVPASVARRVVRSVGAVEGEVNPHEDTRGAVGERVASTRLHASTGPGGGRVVDATVARCRDGIRIDLPIGEGARVYGLGEKTGGLDKAGRTWVFWNSDDPKHLPGKDPLYQSIPVAYVSGQDGVTTVFCDSPAVQYFDVGESAPGVLRIEAYDEIVDLYMRTDPSLAGAVTAFTGLTGRMPLPPEWALGFQQCRYSYFPESRVREVAKRMRAERLPCDVIYLDIHYMDGYRVFTWDRARFPDPAAMIAELREMGFRVVTIVDPGVKVDPDYDVFTEGRRLGLYLSRATGETYVGKVWPGEAAFPDFTKAATREWWADRHRELFDPGVAGIWNDMNEPSDFTGDPDYRPEFTVPDDLVADNDGSPGAFGRVHNAYGLRMSEATRIGFRKLRPQERGFVLTRAGYAGIQRHAAVWTGDNHSWWEHLAMSIPIHLNLGMSGVAFCGADTGGFQDNADGELFARWAAASALMPFFRAHTAIDTIDHEPWAFGTETLDAVRAHVELRYRLVPYIYTLMEEATRTGAPVMRPLIWEFPDDPRLADRADSFMLGSALLVAPVRERGVQERSVYLPAGAWVDVWSGERLEGPVTVVAEAPLDRLPLYQRGGTIVPYETVRQHTGEAGDGVLRLLVAADASGRASGRLYADAGEGFAYRDGEYFSATLSARDGTVTIESGEGSGPAATRWTRIAATATGAGFPLGAVEEARIESGAVRVGAPA